MTESVQEPVPVSAPVVADEEVNEQLVEQVEEQLVEQYEEIESMYTNTSNVIREVDQVFAQTNSLAVDEENKMQLVDYTARINQGALLAASFVSSTSLRVYQEFPVYSLIFINTSIMFLSILWNLVNRMRKNVSKSFGKDVYVFFERNDTPYHTADFKTSGPGISPVAWYYDSKTKTFSNPTFCTSTHHFPMLTAQIKYGDMLLYDISEFVDTLRYNSAGTVPQPELILAAWSLESGVVLSKSNTLKLSTITDEGDNREIPLYGGL